MQMLAAQTKTPSRQGLGVNEWWPGALPQDVRQPAWSLDSYDSPPSVTAKVAAPGSDRIRLDFQAIAEPFKDSSSPRNPTA